MHTFLIILAIFTVIVFLTHRPTSRGKQGEMNMAVRLLSLPESEYTIFNNLLIQKDQYSSQIDHIVVSRYGVFVIETKNMQGWIYGGEHSEYWTQNIWGNKYQLYNPILQNQGHVKALKAYLGVSNSLFIPLVSFSERATLKVRTTENHVLYYSEIVQFIKSRNIELLSENEVNNVIQKLNQLPKYKHKDQQKHIKQARFFELKNQMSVSNNRCPRCGGTLVPRSGPYGSFYGCSNYPKCKFTCK